MSEKILQSSLKNAKFENMTAEQVIKKYEDVLNSREKQVFELSAEIGQINKKLQKMKAKYENSQEKNMKLKNILEKKEALFKQELDNKELMFMQLTKKEKECDEIQQQINDLKQNKKIIKNEKNINNEINKENNNNKKKEEEKKEKNDNSKVENSKDEKLENEIEKPLNDKIKLIFELYQLCDINEEKGKIIESKFSYGLKGILIKKYETFNTLIIPHLTLLGGLIVPEGKSKGKKNENEQPQSQIFPYLLICYIDESIEINNSIAKNELKWNIYIFSSDSVCFVKDTTKEEHERELKENWEVNEPGRASKAKSSRKRFLLEEEQKNGIEISEDDKKFLSTQRIRKTTNEDENVDKDNKKIDNKKNVKSQPKKGDKKDNNKDEPVKRESLKKNKLLPLPNQHCSDYIKNYLEYSYMNRTIQINNIEDQFESKNINFFNIFFLIKNRNY
jgi:hypothetical protein